jgi:2,4-dienoyl-CoA reductase-like NADH-dependent reductase (Old Yellow Enzyme family)
MSDDDLKKLRMRVETVLEQTQRIIEACRAQRDVACVQLMHATQNRARIDLAVIERLARRRRESGRM